MTNRVTEQYNNDNNRNSSNGNCSYRIGERNNDTNTNRKSWKRKRKVIWFNSAFCKLSTINIGKYFHSLIDKHFQNDNPLNKFFVETY